MEEKQQHKAHSKIDKDIGQLGYRDEEVSHNRLS